LQTDAILRAAHTAEEVGFGALLIHACDDGARRFYRRAGGFADSPTDPLYLYRPLKAIRREAAGG
jgi:hypothetical protein